MFDKETIEKIKAEIGKFLPDIMAILSVLDRLDLSFERYDLTFYRVKSIIRIDIKDTQAKNDSSENQKEKGL